MQVNVKKIPVQRNQCYMKYWNTVNNSCLNKGDNVHVCLAFKRPVSSLLCLCLANLSRWIETKIKERNWKVKTLIFINGCCGHVIYLGICVKFYNCYFLVTKVQTLINRAFYDQPHKYCPKFYFPKWYPNSENKNTLWDII